MEKGKDLGQIYLNLPLFSQAASKTYKDSNPGIYNVTATFQSFLNDLSIRRAADLQRLSQLKNGFEGWLKIEFYLWLIAQYELEPDNEDIGLEYKVWLDQRRRQMDRDTKQCDLWVREANGRGFHYIELKVPFANTNQGKMMLSASDDFWYMSRLLASNQSVATGSSILLGVGFTDERWRRAIDEAVEYAGNEPDCVQTEVGCLTLEAELPLRWAVMTKTYLQGRDNLGLAERPELSAQPDV